MKEKLNPQYNDAARQIKTAFLQIDPIWQSQLPKKEKGRDRIDSHALCGEISVTSLLNPALSAASVDIGERSDELFGAVLHIHKVAAQRGGAVQDKNDQSTVLVLRNGGGTGRIELRLLVPCARAGLLPQLDIGHVRLRNGCAVKVGKTLEQELVIGALRRGGGY